MWSRLHSSSPPQALTNLQWLISQAECVPREREDRVSDSPSLLVREEKEKTQENLFNELTLKLPAVNLQPPEY